MSGREGMGALLTQFVTGLTAASAVCRPGDVTRLGGIAVDLLTATLAHQLDAGNRVPEESRQRALLVRIDAFLRRDLHETGLSSATVAAAHHVSVSHLHRLFETRDTTVSAWIRHLRLERAQRDLADPALRAEPIHRIASRCGFGDHATFTRAFRATYDLPPRDYRHRASARRRPTVKRAATVRRGHRPRGPARWCPAAIR
jgi:AraC-like DNA-binding protein